MKVRIILSRSDDPYLNLAAEDRLFRTKGLNERILFLWRNRDAVIMGRYQNPYLECNLPLMRSEEILLVRRQSGGGTVFHDKGNTNFTFITFRDDYDKKKTTEIVTMALQEGFGIPAYPSGRNDIFVDGKKVSGNAFKLTSTMALHHGTLLLESDLEKLSRYLTPEPARIESKGIRSVRSPVTNLSRYSPGIDHDTVCDALITAVCREWGSHTGTVEMDDEDLRALEGCDSKAEELQSWEWIFGKTPPFSVSFEDTVPAGRVTVICRVRGGCFEEAVIRGESLTLRERAAFSKILQGSPCNPHSIREKKKELEGLDTLFDRLAARF